MEREEGGDRGPAGAPDAGEHGGGAAADDSAMGLRDAAEDQAAADRVRRRFRTSGMPAIPADERVAPVLLPGEPVVAVHRGACLDRRTPPPRPPSTGGLAGDLYVTRNRLILVAPTTLSFALEAIEDGVVAGRRLLLILRDGHGLAIDVDRPRLLWAEIVGARARGRAEPGPAPQRPAR